MGTKVNQKINLTSAMGQRLLAVRNAANLSQFKVATACDVSTNTVVRYEKGTRLPPLDFMEAFIARTGANPLYLCLGEGPVLGPYDAPEGLSEEEKVILQLIRHLSPAAKDDLLAMLEGTLAKDIHEKFSLLRR